MNGEKNQIEKIAVVRVRGMWGVKPKIRDTLEKLSLTRVNHCVIIEDTPAYKGMLNICKDYVAYGPISPIMFEKLVMKRGEFPGTKKSPNPKKAPDEAAVKKFAAEYFNGAKAFKDIGLKKLFRLNPPRKGYKSVKKAYPYGALGKWPTLDELLMRMI